MGDLRAYWNSAVGSVRASGGAPIVCRVSGAEIRVASICACRPLVIRAEAKQGKVRAFKALGAVKGEDFLAWVCRIVYSRRTTGGIRCLGSAA